MELTNDFFNLISDFGDDWVITKVEADHKKKEAYIYLKYSNAKYYDPETEEEVALYDHSKERIWRHLDIWDYSTYIVSKVPRVSCRDGGVKQIKLGWSGSHNRHTYSFEIRVIDTLLATKNQTKTSELMRCSFRLVNRIIHQCTERGMQRRSTKKHKFEHISIDEKSFKKGHHYVTVISHPRSGCVIDVGENRDGKSVENLFSRVFASEQLKEILTVSMDMWKAYINSVRKCMPNSEIVHDRFHLVKYLNEAIDKVRKREVKENDTLINSRYALLKNEENRTDKQQVIFDTIISTNLEVAKAYHAKESFKSLFDLHNSDEMAKSNLVKWATNFFTYNIKEVNKVILRILSHSKGVINALISKFNNAMAERLNGKIQEIKLHGRGYRKFQNFRSVILFFHGGLNLYPLKW